MEARRGEAVAVVGGGVRGGRREVLERTAPLEVLHHHLYHLPTGTPHRTAGSPYCPQISTLGPERRPRTILQDGIAAAAAAEIGKAPLGPFQIGGIACNPGRVVGPQALLHFKFHANRSTNAGGASSRTSSAFVQPRVLLL